MKRESHRHAKKETILDALEDQKVKCMKGDKVTFALYKLEATYTKIHSASWGEEVYLVAYAMGLDGKEVTLTIREKEPVVVAENANVPVMEAKENGARLTELKAVFKNGIAKVKVKLRPESDDDLKSGLRGPRKSAWMANGGLRSLRKAVCLPWADLRSLRKAPRRLWHTCDYVRNTTLRAGETCASCAGYTSETGAACAGCATGLNLNRDNTIKIATMKIDSISNSALRWRVTSNG